jgi:hypothetical protein
MIQYISKAFEMPEQLDRALYYYKEFCLVSVNFEQERNQRRLRESELEINVLKQDKEIKEKENQALLYAVALGLIVIISDLVYRNFRNKQKTNQKLEIINNALARKNHLLDKRNVDARTSPSCQKQFGNCIAFACLTIC